MGDKERRKPPDTKKGRMTKNPKESPSLKRASLLPKNAKTGQACLPGVEGGRSKPINLGPARLDDGGGRMFPYYSSAYCVCGSILAQRVCFLTEKGVVINKERATSRKEKNNGCFLGVSLRYVVRLIELLDFQSTGRGVLMGDG